MRVALIVVIVVTSIFASPGRLHAEACAYSDGGYCVSAIADGTAKLLGFDGRSSWQVAAGRESAGMGITGGTNSLNAFEAMWDRMVKNGQATEADRARAFEVARKAGGTKIGGVNLVVLSAATLQHLVDRKMLMKEAAQRMLNEAKVVERQDHGIFNPFEGQDKGWKGGSGGGRADPGSQGPSRRLEAETADHERR